MVKNCHLKEHQGASLVSITCCSFFPQMCRARQSRHGADKAGTIARNVALGIAKETEICLEHLRTTSDNSF